jgi:hypothetical protein
MFKKPAGMKPVKWVKDLTRGKPLIRCPEGSHESGAMLASKLKEVHEVVWFP